MTTPIPKLKPGDRVKIRNGYRVFEVVEVNPVGSGMPAPPSTYLVRIRLPEGVQDLIYGNAGLDRVP